MDYAGEIIALGIDVFILGTCLRSYLKKKNSIAMIQVKNMYITLNLL